jgi:hypothetical protein
MEFGLLACFANTPEASLARLGRQAQGLLKSLATFWGTVYGGTKTRRAALLRAPGQGPWRKVFF